MWRFNNLEIIFTWHVLLHECVNKAYMCIIKGTQHNTTN